MTFCFVLFFLFSSQHENIERKECKERTKKIFPRSRRDTWIPKNGTAHYLISIYNKLVLKEVGTLVWKGDYKCKHSVFLLLNRSTVRVSINSLNYTITQS